MCSDQYEVQPGGAYFHQCYLKTHYPYSLNACNRPPHYVDWGSETNNPNWHGASGPKTCQDVASGCAHGILLGDVTRISHATSCSVDDSVATGCNDPTATNYDASVSSYDHSCRYSFDKGCLDATHAAVDNGHVSVPLTSINSHLPQRDITVEAWINWYHGQQWAGPVSAIQDDGSTEYGFAVSSCCSGTGADPCADGLTMAFAISTESSNTDGDGQIVYVGCDDGDQSNGGHGTRDPRAFIGNHDQAAAGLNEWVHFAGTYDGDEATLHLNGQPIVTSATSSRRQGGDIVYPAPSYASLNGGWFTIGA